MEKIGPFVMGKLGLETPSIANAQLHTFSAFNLWDPVWLSRFPVFLSLQTNKKKRIVFFFFFFVFVDKRYP